jgi:spore protease
MNFRTDLAIEMQEYHKKDVLDGVLSDTRNENGVRITNIEIINENGEKILGKPKGKYITIETDKLYKSSEAFSETSKVLCRELKKLIPAEGTVLVAGLGNEDITPDALGPKVMNMILTTRHINDEFAEDLGLGKLRSVAGIVPGVLGKTGIETVEIIDSVVRKISPDCVIVIDALASRNTARLGTTVQLSNTGIAPGSGVGNRRKGINKNTLNVPVVAIGVPTVVDALTLVSDILENTGVTFDEENLLQHRQMMVTPKEIDSLIDKASRLVAMGINLALQEQLTPEDIAEIVG